MCSQYNDSNICSENTFFVRGISSFQINFLLFDLQILTEIIFLTENFKMFILHNLADLFCSFDDFFLFHLLRRYHRELKNCHNHFDAHRQCKYLPFLSTPAANWYSAFSSSPTPRQLYYYYRVVFGVETFSLTSSRPVVSLNPRLSFFRF